MNALPSTSYDGCRALFVAYGSAHISKVVPVVQELERRNIRCVVMALTLGYRQAVQMGLQPVGYRDFLHLVDEPAEAIEFGKLLAGDNSHPDVDPFETVCYLGVNYAEWVDEYGFQEAQRLYRQGGRRAFRPVKFMRKVIKYLNPDIVISTSSPRSEQAAIEAAVDAGIASLTMMDSFGLPSEPYHQHAIRADRVTVMSGAVRDNLVAMGMERGRIRITGCPGFDRHFDPQWGLDAKQFRARMGWEQKNVVLWAGGLEELPGASPELSGNQLALAVERTLRTFVHQNSNFALVVRYHPSQYHLFPSIQVQDRVHVSNPVDDPIELMVQVADSVVVQASTVGVEAAMMGRRVLALTYSPTVHKTGLNYATLGLAEPIESLHDLCPTLSGEVDLRLDRINASVIGPAAPSVADVILDLVSGRYRNELDC